LLTHILQVLLKRALVALNRAQFRIQPLVLRAAQLALLLLLLNLPLQVPFTVPHLFDSPLLRLDVSLYLLAASDAGLEFKVLLLEACELLHEGVLLLNEGPEAVAEVLGLRLSDGKLSLKLTDTLLKLVSLEVSLG